MGRQIANLCGEMYRKILSLSLRHMKIRMYCRLVMSSGATLLVSVHTEEMKSFDSEVRMVS